MSTRLPRSLPEGVRLFVLSLAIAVALWFFVGRVSPPEPDRSPLGAVTIRNVDVVVTGLANGLNAFSEPRAVDVEVGGPASLAVRPADVRAYAEVGPLGVGTHEVTLRVQVPLGVTSIKVAPPLVRVTVTMP